MSENPVVEVRTYRIKAGLRDEFVRLFEERTGPAQELYGMKVLGPMLDLDDEQTVVWLRSFPSLSQRDRMKREFYEGPEWLEELEALAMPLIEEFAVTTTVVTHQNLDRTLVP